MIGCSTGYVMCCGSGRCASFFYVWMIKCWCLISGTKPSCVSMNNTNRSWNILNWNIRGINSKDKWLALRQKIDESDCNILCLQETKREIFDTTYLKKIALPDLINLPSYPLLELLGVSLWFGMALNSLEKLLHKIGFHFQCSLPVYSPTSLGLSLIFMGPVIHKTKLSLLPGS